MINDGKNTNKHTTDGNKGKKHIPLNMPPLYYLHPSDHPDMNNCIVILEGDNYQKWKIIMCNVFRAKRKLRFLNMT